MQLSAKDAWKRILDEAHRELPDHTIRTWLEPTEAIALDEGRLIVGAPDQFAVEWNETKHATLLSRLAEPVMGQPTSVVFRVHEDRQKRPQMDFFVAPARPRPAVATPVNPRTQPLNERYTFDTSSSASPTSSRPRPPTRRSSPRQDLQPALHLRRHRAGQDPPDAGHRPRRLPRSPKPGCSTSARSSSSTRSSKASTAAPCPSSVGGTARHGPLPGGRRPFPEGKEMMQEEFFHTFNALYEGNKQSCLPPTDPQGDPRARGPPGGRFEWGMVADIGQPDLEHRIAILRKKRSRTTSSSPFRMKCSGSSPRTCDGTSANWKAASSSCSLYASLKHREISIEVAREALSDKIRPGEDGLAAPKALPSINKVDLMMQPSSSRTLDRTCSAMNRSTSSGMVSSRWSCSCFFRRMAIRCSRSGWPMSATIPHSNRLPAGPRARGFPWGAGRR